MPLKAPAEQTNLGSGPAEVDQKMADADVTEDQLTKANEPEFSAAVDAKKEREVHSESAPAVFRESEAGKLQASAAGAQVAGEATSSEMVAVKVATGQKVGAAQGRTQTGDE